MPLEALEGLAVSQIRLLYKWSFVCFVAHVHKVSTHLCNNYFNSRATNRLCVERVRIRGGRKANRATGMHRHADDLGE